MCLWVRLNYINWGSNLTKSHSFTFGDCCKYKREFLDRSVKVFLDLLTVVHTILLCLLVQLTKMLWMFCSRNLLQQTLVLRIQWIPLVPQVSLKILLFVWWSSNYWWAYSGGGVHPCWMRWINKDVLNAYHVQMVQVCVGLFLPVYLVLSGVMANLTALPKHMRRHKRWVSKQVSTF